MTHYKKVIYVWSNEKDDYVPLFVIPDSIFGREKQEAIRNLIESGLLLFGFVGADYKVWEYLESEDHPSKLED